MTMNEIFALVNAGFTKADIMQLLRNEPTPAPATDVVQEPAPTPELTDKPIPIPEIVNPSPAPAPAPAPAPLPVIRTPEDGSQQMFNNLLQQMSQLTQAVYQNNILNSTNTIPAARTAEDITAEIINPKEVHNG